jgi:deoxycytidylate deaminase
MCSRLIINAGIKEVITGFDEHEDQMQASIELLKEAGVKWRRV